MSATPKIAFHAAIDSSGSPFAPWTTVSMDFPYAGSPTEQWKILLGHAILAPSSHNTQPWLFRMRGEELELYADTTRACRVVDPDYRELVMSCGCALFHLRLAMKHFGCFGGVELLPEPTEPELLARVRMGSQGECSPADSLLFHAIPKRRTNRQPFASDPVPPALLVSLEQAARLESAWLQVVSGEEARHGAADLIAEGDRRQWASRRFRLELAGWVRPNRNGARDGIPGYAQGVDDLLSCAGPLVVRTFNLGEGQAAKDHQLAKGSPELAVLGTEGDTRRDWLCGGQALARVLLRARVEDVWASFLNQAIEAPELRPRLARVAGASGFPQVCLRLGFGENIKPTPRREVVEVLL